MLCVELDKGSKPTYTEYHDEMLKLLQGEPSQDCVNTVAFVISHKQRWMVVVGKLNLDALVIKDFKRGFETEIRSQIMPVLHTLLKRQFDRSLGDFLQVMQIAENGANAVKGDGGLQVVHYLEKLIRGAEAEDIFHTKAEDKAMRDIYSWLLLKSRYREYEM